MKLTPSIQKQQIFYDFLMLPCTIYESFMTLDHVSACHVHYRYTLTFEA